MAGPVGRDRRCAGGQPDRPPRPARTYAPSHLRRENAVKHRPLLLLVDDEPDLLLLLERALARDHRVESASNGQEALERLTSAGPRPDLVISDLRMPVMDGGELVAAMRTVPELDQIPVILLTGNDDRSTRLNMLELGVADYLSKPFPPGELQLRVRNTLRGALLLRQVDEARRAAEEANEELRQINDELERFASTAAHDIQAPLANIAGFASLLRDGVVTDDEQQKQLLGSIADNAVRADRLVRGLLEHARSIATADAAADLDLGDLVETATKHLETAVRETGTTITVDSGRAPVRARPVAAESVVLNLLSNAIKYRHPDRAPVIRVMTRPASEVGRVEVVVRDNGRGVPENERERVLDLGAQGSNREEGTGIGLATVRLIVARHGGSIWLTDAPEPGGLEVHFTFPAALGPSAGEDLADAAAVDVEDEAPDADVVGREG